MERRIMIRVLHVVGKMHMAGQETFIMNMYRNMDSSRIQFDFLVHTTEHCAFDDEILERGGRIFRVKKISQDPFRYISSIANIIRKQQYDIVHCHTAHSMGFLVLLAAKRGGAGVRIAHSHNSTYASLPWLHKLAVPFLNHYANILLACSSEAGKWMYGKKQPFQIIYNGVDTERFLFSASARADVRQELKLTDKLVFGHVGRFNRQKNHRFLIAAFRRVYQKNKNAVLLLIGTGEKEDEIKRMTEGYHLGDSVRFLGQRSDIPTLMQAMDVFVMPSLYEGFPVAGVEAQAAGLPCILSDRITKEIVLTPGIQFCPVSEKVDKSCADWACVMLQQKCSQDEERKLGADKIKKAGMDAADTAKKLQRIYESV